LRRSPGIPRPPYASAVPSLLCFAHLPSLHEPIVDAAERPSRWSMTVKTGSHLPSEVSIVRNRSRRITTTGLRVGYLGSLLVLLFRRGDSGALVIARKRASSPLPLTLPHTLATATVSGNQVKSNAYVIS
jgi:hypothetical protein